METNKIKELLLADRSAGMSVRAVCAKIGIPTASFYNYIEGNTKPGSDTLRKFARAYNIRLSELITEIPEDERRGYSIRDGGIDFEKVPFGPAVNDKTEPYNPISKDDLDLLESIKSNPDLLATIQMAKDDSALARQVRRFTQFEKSAGMEDLTESKKVA